MSPSRTGSEEEKGMTIIKNPRAYLAGIAASQIGKHEDGTTNRGSQIAEFQRACNMGAPNPGEGYPWCVAFVDWCIKEFIAAHPGVLSCEKARPKAASVVGFMEWAEASGQKILPPTATSCAGDIVTMKFATGNHIGIVAIPDTVPGACHTIEGNTSGTSTGDQRNGGEVASKFRGAPEIRAFIRLSIIGESPNRTGNS